MNKIYVVFQPSAAGEGDIIAFESIAQTLSYIAHPSNQNRALDYQEVPFRGLPVDLTVPAFVQ